MLSCLATVALADALDLALPDGAAFLSSSSSSSSSTTAFGFDTGAGATLATLTLALLEVLEELLLEPVVFVAAAPEPLELLALPDPLELLEPLVLLLLLPLPLLRLLLFASAAAKPNSRAKLPPANSAKAAAMTTAVKTPA